MKKILLFFTALCFFTTAITQENKDMKKIKKKSSLYTSFGVGTVLADKYRKNRLFPAQQVGIGYNKGIFSTEIAHQFYYRYAKDIHYVQVTDYNDFKAYDVTGKALYSMLNVNLNLTISKKRYVSGIKVAHSFFPNLLYLKFQGVDDWGNVVTFQPDKPKSEYWYARDRILYIEPGLFFGYDLNSVIRLKAECIFSPFNYCTNWHYISLYPLGDDGTFFNQVNSNIVQFNVQVMYHFLPLKRGSKKLSKI